MEQQKKYRIALISPSQNAYSETFIQAQKKYLKGTVFYYFGGVIPSHLEAGTLKLSLFNRFVFKIKKKFKYTDLSYKEYALVKSFKQHNIHIVLAQYGTTGHHLIRVCKYLNIPLITHFHGYDASVHEVVKAHNNYKEVFSYSSSVIAVSKVMRSKLVELGCPSEKVIYNSCTPNGKFFKVKPKFLKKQFIGVGRFTDKKAPYYTILAFKEVVSKHPEAKLILAGDGFLFNVCKNLINFYKLEDNIKLVGVITPEKFRAYLSESMAFVQHSICAENGDMEGTPVAVLEANAASLPVISTYHGGISDAIINNETGLLVEEHDVLGMAENMLKVLNDKDLAIQLGKNGKERIRKNFTLEKQLNVLDALIEKAILDT